MAAICPFVNLICKASSLQLRLILRRSIVFTACTLSQKLLKPISQKLLMVNALLNSDPLNTHLQHLTEEERYDIMERAAIMEYDGKLIRKEAEMEATGGVASC